MTQLNAAQDMILQLLTAKQTSYTAKSPAKESGDQGATFGDLLTQKRAQSTDTPAQETTETPAQSTETAPAEEQEMTTEQMELLAAMNASMKTIVIVPDVKEQPLTAPVQTVEQTAQIGVTPAQTAQGEMMPDAASQQTAQQPMQNVPAAPVAEANAAAPVEQVMPDASAAQQTLAQQAVVMPQRNDAPAIRETMVQTATVPEPQQKVTVNEITYTAPVANVESAQPETKASVDMTRDFSLTATTSETKTDMLSAETLQTTAQPVFTVVEAAPVKVAEAPVVDTTAPAMEADLSKLVADAAQAGKESITIRLAPESLGEMEVRITRGTDGALQVVMTTTTERAQTLLEKHAANLQTMLGANARGEVEVEVTRGQQAQEHSFERDAQHHGGQEQQEQQRQNHRQRSANEDFLQQLRLGLLSLDAQAI